jgi:DNA (cytosine-5)-methyltransferase 1
MSAITFGSVCSGIEAASVAWHPLGWRAAWLAEIESNPSAMLAHHYPDVPNLGDMNRIPQLLRNGEIAAPDVFCGGTPCQAFSVAGLRNSLDDARGNLSLKFCDISNEIDIQRAAAGLLPAVIFWENVPGVLSTKDNAFGCFLGQLAGEDRALVPPGGKWTDAGCVLGPQRAIAWRILDAQFFGLAQRRRRVFVVASAREGFDPAAILLESEGVRRDSAPSRSQGQDVTGTLSSRTSGGGGLGTDFDCAGGLQPVRSVLRGGGNTSGELDVAAEGFDASEDGAGRGQSIVATAIDIRNGKLYADGPTMTLQSGGIGEGRGMCINAIPHVTLAMAVRRLTPRECERLQGFPDDYTLTPVRGKTAADGPRYKALGNSWAVPVVRWIGRRIDAALRAQALEAA